MKKRVIKHTLLGIISLVTLHLVFYSIRDYISTKAIEEESNKIIQSKEARDQYINRIHKKIERLQKNEKHLKSLQENKISNDSRQKIINMIQNKQVETMEQKEIQLLLQQLGDHLEELQRLFEQTSEEITCRKPTDTTWSAKELLGHLFDTELVFQYRLKKIMEEELPEISGYHQNIWVEEQEYNQWDTKLLVDALITLRRVLIFWLGRIDSHVWYKKGKHSERGEVTFLSIVELLLKHFKHHVMQIKERIKGS